MAVRKGDQDQGKITAIDASRILIDYTYDRVHDKTLPKTDRWLMTKTIWDDAAIAKLLGKQMPHVVTLITSASGCGSIWRN